MVLDGSLTSITTYKEVVRLSFLTNVTTQFSYREPLRRWIKQIAGVAEFLEKAKETILTVRYDIFEACTLPVQNWLSKAITLEKLS